MGKIDSLEFLDSFIEQIDSLTDEEVEMYKKNYQNELNNKIQQQQFDFIPPFNENDIDIKESKTTLLNDYSYNKLDVFYKGVDNNINENIDKTTFVYAALGVFLVRSGFQFANPILERVSFVTNNKFDSDKFEGIDIESQTSVEMHEENTAKVSLNVIVGSSEDNQPFNIDIVMSAKFRWRDTIDIAKVKELLKVNGASVLLSYIRPIVANLTNSSQYSVLNIPFMDFTQSDSK